MAQQGRMLKRLCHSLWRMNVTGTRARVDAVAQSSPPCQHLHHHHHHHHLSSSSAVLPASPHFSPALLTASPSDRSSNGSSLPTVPRIKDPSAAVHTKNSSNWQKEADSNILSGTVLKHKSRVIKENNVSILNTTTTTNLSPTIWDVNQTGRGRGGGGRRHGLSLATWPDIQHMEYSCPSEKLTSLPELTFLDPLPVISPRELPSSTSSSTILPVIIIHDPKTTTTTISEPTDETGLRNAPKEARKIMKIRRKKMKRHLLKKFRKRMAFTLRKIKRERRKKKEAVFQARLNTIQEWGDNFDARQWVKDQLDEARRGGFYINVLEEDHKERQAGSKS